MVADRVGRGSADMAVGRVESIGPGTVVVRMQNGGTVIARNGLHARLPPNSAVVVARTPDGRYDVVSRRRGG